MEEVLTSASVSHVETSVTLLKAKLFVEPLTWPQAFETMTINFGTSDSRDYELRRHRSLGKRQAATVNIPTPTAIYPAMSSGTPIATFVSAANLHQQMINQTLASLSATQQGSGSNGSLS